MRTLFIQDLADYDPSWPRSYRPSARGIICRNGKVALVYSAKYDFYSVPGGGIEHGESHEDAIIREVREETGLCVIPGSVRPFGQVVRIQSDRFIEHTVFEQANYYYLCDAGEALAERRLEAYEADEGYTLTWITPAEAIAVNRRVVTGNPPLAVVMDREARVLEMLVENVEI